MEGRRRKTWLEVHQHGYVEGMHCRIAPNVGLITYQTSQKTYFWCLGSFWFVNSMMKLFLARGKDLFDYWNVHEYLQCGHLDRCEDVFVFQVPSKR